MGESDCLECDPDYGMILRTEPFEFIDCVHNYVDSCKTPFTIIPREMLKAEL